MTRIGWYIHHHGSGHLRRFLSIRPFLDAEVVCFSSLPEPAALPPRTAWVHLPADDVREDHDGWILDPRSASPTARGALHWAPLGHHGHSARLRQVVDVLTDLRIGVVVVDVSVEVAVLARLLGVAVVVVAQPGTRDDLPHSLAYTMAEQIIAPWPDGLIRAAHLDTVRDRVTFTGGISRYATRSAEIKREQTGVLLLGGRGGASPTMDSVAAAQEATPGIPWTAIGVAEPDSDDVSGWVDDPWPAILGAEVVVSWAGENAVADLAAAGARAVIIPQERPFEEQRTMAAALREHGLATVMQRWPAPHEWPGVLKSARRMQPTWGRWQTDGAAERAAAAIEQVAVTS